MTKLQRQIERILLDDLLTVPEQSARISERLLLHINTLNTIVVDDSNPKNEYVEKEVINSIFEDYKDKMLK